MNDEWALTEYGYVPIKGLDPLEDLQHIALVNT